MNRFIFAAVICLACTPAFAQRIITHGATDQSVKLLIIDETTGIPETGVVFNTAGIDLWYQRQGSAKVSITETTGGSLTTHVDNTITEVQSGVYELDLPDAAWATGSPAVEIGGSITGMIVKPVTVQLTAFNLQDGTALSTQASNDEILAVLGTPVGADLSADIASATLTANDIQTAVFGIAGRTLDVTVTGEAGLDFDNTAGTLDAAEIATDAIGADEIAAGAIGAGEIAGDAIGASEIASDAIAAAEISSTAAAEMQAGLATQISVDALPTAAENTSDLLNTVLTDTGATELGRTLYWLHNAFASDGVFDEPSLANAPAGGGGGSLTDVDQEPVPTSRVFTLVRSEDGGLESEDAKSITVGESPTFAVDFASDMPTNERINTVSAPTIATGTSGGITFDDLGRDKSQAKFRATAVTAGEYVVHVEVEYRSGATAVGIIRFTVVD